MLIDIQPLLAAISDESPAGQDARDTPDYESVAAEFEKQHSPTNTEPIDWQKVDTLCTRLLSGQCKDFMLAAWLAVSWMQRQGIEGLSAGIGLFDGLVAGFWPVAQPPLKRLRGRRNAIEWWLESCTDWLQNKDLPALRADMLEAMRQTARRLDAQLAELDPDGPTVRPLLQQIERLAVIDEPPEPNAPPPAPTPSSPAPGAPEAPKPAPSSTTPAAPEATKPAGAGFDEPAPVSASKPASPPPGAISLEPPPALGAAPTGDIQEIIAALAPAFAFIGKAVNALRQIDNKHHLSVDLGRLAARGMLFECPPANQGLTAIMPPPIAISDAFATVARSGNPDGLAEFCESRIAAFPFWLDLDRASAQAFAMLGAPGAGLQRAVIENALAFTKRLAGIESLKFSDGTPFADDATRQWLDQCRAEYGGATQNDDPLEKVKQRAAELTAAGQGDAALEIYREYIESSWSGRTRLRARLALARAAMAIHPERCALPAALAITRECSAMDLNHWEPELARQAWELQLQTAQNSLERAAATPEDKIAAQQHHAQATIELAALGIF